MGTSRALKFGLIALLMVFPAARAAAKSPVEVNGDELQPITFSRLILRLDRQDDIGIGKAEFRVRFLEELRRLGYPAVGAESLVFDKDNSGQARFLLGGTVTKLICNLTYGILSTGRACGIAVSWEVLDADLDRVVYRVLTKYEVRGTGVPDESLGRELVMGAFYSLLSRPRFVDVLRKHDARATARYALAKFRPCHPPAITMPRNADLVLRASVMVESEGGHGSGVFVSPDGLVLTAAHVVRSTPRAKLRLQDGSELEAALVRIDTDADVALLRAQRPAAAAACLALRQTAVPTGEEIYAVGAPLDRSLAFSLTRGIVSGTREVRGTTLLQTDASVNPGNSGGPLVDDSGRAVAIVRSKAVGLGVEGVAFGVPVAVAIARLGIAPGEATDVVLFQAAARPPEAAPVDDVADDLHPRPVPVSTSAPAQSVRGRASSPAEPSSWRTWRKVGWVAGGLGLITVAGSAYAYGRSSDTLTQARFDKLRTINDAGWVVTAAAAVLVISSYALDDSGSKGTALGLGPTSVSLMGRF